MATTKTARLTTTQAIWLREEAARAKVSENRILQALIDEAMGDDWHFGQVTMHAPPPSHPVWRNPLGGRA